jgi:hypothetical protein
MKFSMWLFAGSFLLINCVFFFRYLWQHGDGGGLVIGSAIIALGLSAGTTCLLKAMATLRASK